MSEPIAETGNRKPESATVALQKFIDNKVPKHLQGNYEHDISMLKGGWHAALAFTRNCAAGIITPEIRNLAAQPHFQTTDEEQKKIHQALRDLLVVRAAMQ